MMTRPMLSSMLFQELPELRQATFVGAGDGCRLAGELLVDLVEDVAESLLLGLRLVDR